MAREINRKISRSSGFSMVEMLLAMMILLLSSSILASNMPLIRKAYTELTQSANAQVLLSTAMVRLRDELGSATEVYLYSEKEISYRNGGPEQFINSASSGDEPEEIRISYSKDEDSEASSPLMSPGESTDGLTISYESVSLTDGGDGRADTITFTGLRVKNKGQDLTLAGGEKFDGEKFDFVIRTIARPKIRSLLADSS